MNKMLLKLVATLSPSKAMRYAVKHNDVDNYTKLKQDMRPVNSASHKFKYNFAICAIVKNEAPYLAEWIEYHKLLGTERFIIYDNESNDNIMDILGPYIDSGIVEYHFISGAGRQIDAYNKCLNLARGKIRWLAFIDIDEFIFPVLGESIPQMLQSYDKYPALAMHWMIYGDSHHKTKTNGLVIERFTMHANTNFIKNQHVKVIVHPHQTYHMNIHNGIFINGKHAVNENCRVACHAINPKITMSRVRVNHYYGKSYTEYLDKRARGSNAIGAVYERTKFDQHNRNDVTDDCMTQFVKPIYKQITRRFKK